MYNIESLLPIVTFFVTLILGQLAKHVKYIDRKLIPLQNLIVGIISVIIYYLVTKDLNISLATVGLFTGGTYDLYKNLKEL